MIAKKIGFCYKTFAIYWIPVFAWAGVIFWLSAQPSLLAEVESGWQLVLSILGHWFEYLVLSLLLARALSRAEFPIKKALVWAFGISLTYGILDEFHQLFVLGREASLADVGLDAMGAILGSFLLFERFLRKFPESFGQERRAFSDSS